MTTSLTTKEAPSRLANFLGWFSIAFGLAEIIAPRRLGRMVGVSGKGDLLQAYGLRELLSGLAILVSRRKAPWLWARVAGDAMDAATLAPGIYSLRKSQQLTSGIALAAVAAIGLLDIYAATQAQARQ